MAEYIDREPLKNKLQQTAINPTTKLINTILIGLLDEAPTADVVEVRHGKWHFRKSWNYFVCSECSFEHTNYSHYCPNCGTKMDGKGEQNV